MGTNKGLKIGFDFDGVLCTSNLTLLRLMDLSTKETREALEEWYYREQKPELNPELFLSDGDEFIVITGRFNSLKKLTEKWLNKFCPNVKKIIYVDLGPAYDCSKDEVINWSIKLAELKAKAINEEKLDVFFEDNGDTVKRLRELCPNTKIIKYGGKL